MPLLVIILIMADKLLLIFGNAYSENGAALLRLLSLSVIPFTFVELWVTIRRVNMTIKPVLAVYTASGSIILVLGFLFMSLIGLAGIGVGWVLGQTTVALVLAVYELVRSRRRKGVKLLTNGNMHT